MPTIYIPRSKKALLYFENDVVQIDLDDSYLIRPETAAHNARRLLENEGLEPEFFEPKTFTSSSLPDIPTHFDFMCCPRSISDLSSKIGLGYLGPRVRRIVQSARFPVLITSPAFKAWTRVAVFFGGSSNARVALKLGFMLSRVTAQPLDVFTQAETQSPAYYKNVIEEERLHAGAAETDVDWHFFENGNFEENLYEVPHDALVVMGATGHGLIKDLLFGSKMETVQSILPNNLLIAGPDCFASF